MRLSKRSELPGETHPLALLREKLAGEGREVLDWSHGNPTTAKLGWPTPAVVDAFAKDAWLAYEPAPLGLPHAREALATHLAREGLSITADDVVVVASTSEAYANLFKILCDAGDNVLVPAPSYPLFDELARWEGIELRPYRLAYAGEWHVDLASVRAACNERTRAILVVSPNNPTGSCLTEDELRLLAGFGVPIIADEVFCKAPAKGNARTLSARTVLHDHAHVVLDGLSKRLALPQVKCGWMLLGGPQAFRRELSTRLEYALDAQLSLSVPEQHALIDLLALEANAVEALAFRITESERALRSAFSGTMVSVLERQAGWCAVLRVPCDDDEHLAMRLLDAHGVYAMPGAFFAFAGAGFLVVSLLTDPADVKRAAVGLLDVLAEG